MKPYKHLIFRHSFINGKWTKESNKNFDIINPSTGKKIISVFDNGEKFMNKAIEAAHASMPKWKALAANERSAIMLKWFDLIHKNKEAIASIMTLESGKPYQESLGEINYGAAFIQWFAEESKRIYGDIIPGFSSDKRIVVIRQPIGVVGAITPWNFPLAMITRKIAPALAAGCSVVVRPSELTPLTALAINKLAQDAGFPNGVINTVVGLDASKMGLALCAHEKVAKISFTGSTRVGQILSAQSAQTLKKLSLELGGNAPMIIFEDADIDAAIKGTIAGKFRFSGQTCVCINRILVHEKIYDTFVKKFTTAVKELIVGDGFAKNTQIGPVIHQKAIEKAQDFIKDAIAKGGKIKAGGKILKGLFFEPTVIADATEEMNFAQEEIFGPIAPIFKFSTDQEAINMANNTIFGLASYFYSKDINRIIKVSEALEYGIVGVNEGLISSEVVPFGGVKYSGSGREGSKYGIEDYTELKYICIGGVK